MTLSVGDSFPSGVKFTYVPWHEENKDVAACGIPTAFDVDKKLGGKKFVVVAVPGAFTPTCTANHIPPFKEHLAAFKKAGVEEIIVIAANDPFVMAAWGKALGFKDEIIFASDPLASFSESIGWSQDLSDKGLGVRTDRYALIVDNGKVTYAKKEPGPGVSVSGAEALLEAL